MGTATGAGALRWGAGGGKRTATMLRQGNSKGGMQPMWGGPGRQCHDATKGQFAGYLVQWACDACRATLRTTLKHTDMQGLTSVQLAGLPSIGLHLTMYCEHSQAA